MRPHAPPTRSGGASRTVGHASGLRTSLLWPSMRREAIGGLTRKRTLDGGTAAASGRRGGAELSRGAAGDGGASGDGAASRGFSGRRDGAEGAVAGAAGDGAATCGCSDGRAGAEVVWRERRDGAATCGLSGRRGGAGGAVAGAAGDGAATCGCSDGRAEGGGGVAGTPGDGAATCGLSGRRGGAGGAVAGAAGDGAATCGCSDGRARAEVVRRERPATEARPRRESPAASQGDGAKSQALSRESAGDWGAPGDGAATCGSRRGGAA